MTGCIREIDHVALCQFRVGVAPIAVQGKVRGACSLTSHDDGDAWFVDATQRRQDFRILADRAHLYVSFLFRLRQIVNGGYDRRQGIDAFDDILVLAHGGGECFGIRKADDAGNGEADQDADGVPQQLVDDRPMPNPDGGDDERRHQPIDGQMPEKAGCHQIARFRPRGLHGVADHVAVDDDAVAVHEPGSRRGREYQQDQKRLDEIFGGKNGDERAEKRRYGDIKPDDGDRIGGKIGVNLRPERLVCKKQQIGCRQQTERHAADFRTKNYSPSRFRGKKRHYQVPPDSLGRASAKKVRTPVFKLPQRPVDGGCII